MCRDCSIVLYVESKREDSRNPRAIDSEHDSREEQTSVFRRTIITFITAQYHRYAHPLLDIAPLHNPYGCWRQSHETARGAYRSTHHWRVHSTLDKHYKMITRSSVIVSCCLAGQGYLLDSDPIYWHLP